MKLSDFTEPARLRALATALFVLLGAIGVTFATDLPRAVDGLIVALFTLAPLAQGESTRAAVFSPATHAAELQEAQEAAKADAIGDTDYDADAERERAVSVVAELDAMDQRAGTSRLTMLNDSE